MINRFVRNNPFLATCLVALICALLAVVGVKVVIKPSKEWEFSTWLILISIFMLGFQALIIWNFQKEKKKKEILEGKKPIE